MGMVSISYPTLHFIQELDRVCEIVPSLSKRRVDDYPGMIRGYSEVHTLPNTPLKVWLFFTTRRRRDCGEAIKFGMLTSQVQWRTTAPHKELNDS